MGSASSCRSCWRGWGPVLAAERRRGRQWQCEAGVRDCWRCHAHISSCSCAFTQQAGRCLFALTLRPRAHPAPLSPGRPQLHTVTLQKRYMIQPLHMQVQLPKIMECVVLDKTLFTSGLVAVTLERLWRHAISGHQRHHRFGRWHMA